MDSIQYSKQVKLKISWWNYYKYFISGTHESQNFLRLWDDFQQKIFSLWDKEINQRNKNIPFEYPNIGDRSQQSPEEITFPSLTEEVSTTRPATTNRITTNTFWIYLV